MTALRILPARLIGLFGGDARRERELRAEIDAHIAEAAEDFERQGVPVDEARRLAFAKFGGMTQTIEAHRERRRFRPLAIEEPAEVLEIFNSSDRYKDPHLPKHSYQAYKSLREARTMFEGLLATWTVTRPVNVAPSETSAMSYAGRLQG